MKPTTCPTDCNKKCFMLWVKMPSMPLQKKANMDTDSPSNFWLISKFPILPKWLDLQMICCSLLTQRAVLLDLTAAFASRKALQWFASHLSDLTFVVNTEGVLSNVAPLLCGVPQGSLFGPLLFSLHLSPLAQIYMKPWISDQCYASDTKTNFPFKSRLKHTFSSV